MAATLGGRASQFRVSQLPQEDAAKVLMSPHDGRLISHACLLRSSSLACHGHVLFTIIIIMVVKTIVQSEAWASSSREESVVPHIRHDMRQQAGHWLSVALMLS